MTEDNPKIVSMFSGCGGLDLGFKKAGFEIVYASDYADFLKETYDANHETELNVEDIREMGRWGNISMRGRPMFNIEHPANIYEDVIDDFDDKDNGFTVPLYLSMTKDYFEDQMDEIDFDDITDLTGVQKRNFRIGGVELVVIKVV